MIYCDTTIPLPITLNVSAAKIQVFWAVVVAQLAEQRSAVRIQSSVNFCKERSSIVNCVEKTKLKKKRPGMAHLQKRKKIQVHFLIIIDCLPTRN